MKKIALFITWFGKDIQGGAEAQAYQIAKHLMEIGIHIEIWTTCSRSFHHCWDENFHTPGLKTESELRVRRFKVDERQSKKFDRIVEKLLAFDAKELHPGIFPVSKQSESCYWENNITSTELIQYAVDNQNEYLAILAMPYLFPLTVHLALILKEKVWIQPCLHDEPYAYLRLVSESFKHCGKILFNSDGEKKVFENIFGNIYPHKSFIVYEGIETENQHTKTLENLSADKKQILSKKFILYLGKKCPEKNVPELIEAFQQFRINYPNSSLILALAGTGKCQFLSDHIIDLGILDNSVKELFLKNAIAVAIPSSNESFSRVLYEAWHQSTPVIVDEHCIATKEAVLRSSENEAQVSGYIARNTAGWIAAIAKIDSCSKSTLKSMGEIGRKYSNEIANWNKVAQRYEKLIEKTEFTRTNFKYEGLQNSISVFETGYQNYEVEVGKARNILDQKYELIFFAENISEQNFQYLQNFLQKRKTLHWLLFIPESQNNNKISSKKIEYISERFYKMALLLSDIHICSKKGPFYEEIGLKIDTSELNYQDYFQTRLEQIYSDFRYLD